MRINELFYNLILNNKRINLNDERQQDLKQDVADVFVTIDAINHLDRLDDVLGKYQVQEYQIHDVFASLIFPKAVTFMPGPGMKDYRDRDYRFCSEKISLGGESYTPTVLTPGAFKEALLNCLSVMKVVPQDTSFKAVSRVEIVIGASQERFAVKKAGEWVTKAEVQNDFPIPITEDYFQKRVALNAMDDEYLREWLLYSIINKLNVRS